MAIKGTQAERTEDEVHVKYYMAKEWVIRLNSRMRCRDSNPPALPRRREISVFALAWPFRGRSNFLCMGDAGLLTRGNWAVSGSFFMIVSTILNIKLCLIPS